MAALPASGGVRSLLAKFENTNNNTNNADVSPSRGRSSGDSNDNAANRPLSKVRASFVSVERNGQGSPTPGVLRRTESYGTEADSSQRSATVSPTGQPETSLASPFSPSPQKIRTALASFQGDSVGSVNEKLASLAVKDNVQSPPLSKKPETPQEQPPSAAATTVEKPSTKPTNGTSMKQPDSKAIKKSASTMSIAKEAPANKSTTKSTTTATAKEKKPAVPPTRSATTTTRPTGHADKPAGHKTAAVRNTAPTGRPERAKTPSKDAAKRPSIQPSPQTKPAPKSPTRPVRLPASLVTPTAASAARTGALARSQSHLNLRSSPKTETAKTLSRKPSTLRADAARISAAHSIPDRPRSRISTTSSRAPQEESFLARMMRPTASSASKMHDKIEPRSPPRLAKAAKLTPKKETPAKHAGEEDHENHENSRQDKTASPAAAKKKVEQPVVKEAPAIVAKNPEPPVTPVAESFKTEPELSLTSDKEASETSPAPAPAPAPAAAPAPFEPAVVEAEVETEAPTSSDSAVIEAKPEDSEQKQPPQADDAVQKVETLLASVPESVPEEDTAEAEQQLEANEASIQEPAADADQKPEAKDNAATEPAAEVHAPQSEEVRQPAGGLKDDENGVNATEPVQPQEESVEPAPVVSEDLPAEPSTYIPKTDDSLLEGPVDEEEEEEL